MKTFIIMSWRNMWRNKKRSLVVILSIAIGILGMHLSMGFMNSMSMQMIDNTINTSLGHVAIHKKGYQDSMKLDYNFKPEKKYIDTIEQLVKQKKIKAFAPRVKVEGMARSSESARGVLVIGIEPDVEKNVSKLYDYTIKKNGSRYITKSDRNSVLISKYLADKLELSLGDKLVLLIQNKNKKIEGVGLTIVGLYQTPIESFDKYVVYMQLFELKKITGLGENISELTVVTYDKTKALNIRDLLKSKINNTTLEYLSWQDMAPALVKAVELFEGMIAIFFMIVFITVVFSVANTLIMSIMERFHEIGVMKCIGTSPLRIFFMIVFEAVNLGVVGIVAGSFAGVFIVGLFSITGVDLSFYIESMRALGSGSVLYPYLKFNDIVVTVMVVMMTTLIAALYPAVKASRIKPLEALHYI